MLISKLWNMETQWSIVITSCMPYHFLSSFSLFAHVHWEAAFCFPVGDDHNKVKKDTHKTLPKVAACYGSTARKKHHIIHVHYSFSACITLILYSLGRSLKYSVFQNYLSCLNINIEITKQGKVSIMHS